MILKAINVSEDIEAAREAARLIVRRDRDDVRVFTLVARCEALATVLQGVVASGRTR
jgi:hypothetical protein